MQPSIGDAALQPLAVVPSRLLRLCAHYKAGRAFRASHLRVLRDLAVIFLDRA
jgi:hypothetical protein